MSYISDSEWNKKCVDFNDVFFYAYIFPGRKIQAGFLE